MLSTSSYNDAVDFNLRDFRAVDFDWLWEIDQRCFAPGIAYSRRELSAYIRLRGAFTLVAEEQSASGQGGPAHHGIAGFIVATLKRRRIGHIITIDVLPENRRSGLGSTLLNAAEARLRVQGCLLVELETAVDNTSALAFYKRHRYSVTRIVPRYYSNGLDAFVLEKELREGA